MTLHRFFRWVARRAIRWFYRDAQIIGQENIPRDGATLLVASHSNDVPDILLTLSITNRRVLFVANVAAGNSIPAKLTYAALDVIPIARIRDARAMRARGDDAAALNERAFARVTAALRAGQVVAIFPEGKVNELPHLAPIRTGAARMALEAITNGVEHLSLVPIGYQYEKQDQPRSGLLTVVGTPTRVERWQPANHERAVPEFTRHIRQQLQHVTRTAATWADVAELNQIAAAVGAVQSSSQQSPIAAACHAQRIVASTYGAEADYSNQAISGTASTGPQVGYPDVAQAVARQVENPAVALQTELEFVQRESLDLSTAVVALGGQPWSAADHAIVLRALGDTQAGASSPSAFAIWMTAPLAALGWLWHGVPFWFVYRNARSKAPHRVEVAGMAMIPGVYIMEAWYAAISALLWLAGLNLWLVLVTFIVQPRLGDLACWWRDGVRAQRLHARAKAAPATQRQAVLESAQRLRGAWAALERHVEAKFDQEFDRGVASR